MDIFYDHFLAKNWATYCNIPLNVFAQDFYALLNDQYEILPERNKDMIPHMMRYNWLVSYASLEGIDRTLKQMDSRTKMRSGMGSAVDEIKQYYNEYEEEFKAFFDEIQHHIKQKLNEF
jgi:acyl carrier protein phosphodiesterase